MKLIVEQRTSDSVPGPSGPGRIWRLGTRLKLRQHLIKALIGQSQLHFLMRAEQRWQLK